MKSTLILASVLLFNFNLTAQENQTLKQKLKSLDFMLGQWNVEVKTRLSAQGPWETTKGSSVIKRTLDSALVEEEFTGVHDGQPFLSKTLLAINNQTDRYQRIFIDAPHGTLIDFEGGMENGALVFDKTWTYASGSTVKLRVVYQLLSSQSFVIETMRMPQGQNEWSLTGQLKYNKIK